MNKRWKKEENWILQEKYHGKETGEFFNDLKRLETGEPVDYIIGNRPFQGATIDLAYRPLIPREETEYWTKRALELISRHYEHKELRILDMGAGSGCIGIAALYSFPSAFVSFADIDVSAVKQIQKNLQINRLSKKAAVYQSDCFEHLPAESYDVIFTNPPYIPEENYARLSTSVKNFEPKNALCAKENGLFLVKKLLTEGAQRLAPNGMMFLEFDTPQKEKIELFVSKTLPLQYEFWKDQFGNFRTVVIKKTPRKDL